jgi:hypothetical protein
MVARLHLTPFLGPLLHSIVGPSRMLRRGAVVCLAMLHGVAEAQGHLRGQNQAEAVAKSQEVEVEASGATFVPPTHYGGWWDQLTGPRDGAVPQWWIRWPPTALAAPPHLTLPRPSHNFPSILFTFQIALRLTRRKLSQRMYMLCVLVVPDGGFHTRNLPVHAFHLLPPRLTQCIHMPNTDEDKSLLMGDDRRTFGGSPSDSTLVNWGNHMRSYGVRKLHPKVCIMSACVSGMVAS